MHSPMPPGLTLRFGVYRGHGGIGHKLVGHRHHFINPYFFTKGNVAFYLLFVHTIAFVLHLKYNSVFDDALRDYY